MGSAALFCRVDRGGNLVARAYGRPVASRPSDDRLLAQREIACTSAPNNSIASASVLVTRSNLQRPSAWLLLGCWPMVVNISTRRIGSGICLRPETDMSEPSSAPRFCPSQRHGTVVLERRFLCDRACEDLVT